MGIRFACPDCDHPLNIKQDLAGKRSKCPQCGRRFRIPSQDQPYADPAGDSEIQSLTEAAPPTATAPSASGPSSKTVSPEKPVATKTIEAPLGTKKEAGVFMPPIAAAPRVEDALADQPTASWYVRPPSGGQYGPAGAEVMRQWLAENRVGAASLVWREGWTTWRKAAEVFPQLATAASENTLPDASPPSPSAWGTSGGGEAFHRRRAILQRRKLLVSILAGLSLLLIIVLAAVVMLN